jgi:hypothetical protein
MTLTHYLECVRAFLVYHRGYTPEEARALLAKNAATVEHAFEAGRLSRDLGISLAGEGRECDCPKCTGAVVYPSTERQEVAA